MVRQTSRRRHPALLLACGLLCGVANADVVRLSEPVEATDTYETFGAPLPLDPRAPGPIPLSTLLTNGAEHLDSPILVETRVAQVCQAKGCFFIAQEGAHAARVSFQDYRFFVPSDISGRTVILAGSLLRRDLSAAQAAHLNADAGDDDAIRPGAQYEIVATSVRVLK